MSQLDAAAFDDVEVVPGEEDPASRTEATLRWRGKTVGRAVYSRFAGTVLVHELEIPGRRRVDLLASTIGTLASMSSLVGLYSGYYHPQVSDPVHLLAYKASAIAPAAMASGAIGTEALMGVPLLEVPESLIRNAEPDQTHVTIHWQPPADTPPLDRASLERALGAERVTERVMSLRAAVCDDDLPADLRDAAFLFALLDPETEVRRFAGVTMAGGYLTNRYLADVDRVIDHIQHPLRSLDELGVHPVPGRGGAWDPTHGRLNKRLALLWALGLMAMRSTAIQEHIRSALEADSASLDARRDRQLLAWAKADEAHVSAQGIGGADRCGVLDLARYAVLRDRLGVATCSEGMHPYYWVRDMVDEMVGGGRAGDALDRVMFAPSPATAVGLR